MKKKTNFVLALLIAVLATGFTSCGSDDDRGGSGHEMSGAEAELMGKLQGTWEFTSGKETAMGYSFNITPATLTDFKNQMRSQGVNIEFWDQTLIFNGTKVNDVPYTLRGTQLILEGMEEGVEGFSFTVNVGEITETSLVLHEVIAMAGNEIVADMKYKRK